MRHSLNSLEGGCIGDYIGHMKGLGFRDYCRAN